MLRVGLVAARLFRAGTPPHVAPESFAGALSRIGLS